MGRLSGWMLLAFIAGVALHSVFRYWHLSAIVWTGAFLFLLGVLFSVRKHRTAACATLVCCAFAFGLWRCDVAPSPKLRRFDGKLFLASHASSPTGPLSILGEWRRSVTSRIASVLPPDAAGLVAGILYGDVQFSKTQRELFVSSGLLHIVAVSGSNVTILVQFLSGCVLGLGLKRRQAFIVTSCAIFLYVGFVGFAASVARAAFMGWLILLAREVGRVASPFRLLLVAATILLLINPWQLFFDIGFALSFMATWGLLTWAQLFHGWLKFLPKRFGIRETFSMTLAATLMTAPYLAWAFERLSLAGLLTNILALPLIPFVMGWGAFAALWGNFPAHAVVSAPVLGLVSAISWIAGLTRFMPWLSFRMDGAELSTMLATYLLIIHLWTQLSRKKDLSTEL